VIGGGLALAIGIAVLGLATAEFTGYLVIEPGTAIAVITAVVVLELPGTGTGRGRTAILVIALAIQVRMMFGSVRAAARRTPRLRAPDRSARAHPRGTVASVPPYPRRATTWFFGEDFRYSDLRDRVATRMFGLRGITLAPGRREYQDVPPLALHHEVSGDARGFLTSTRRTSPPRANSSARPWSGDPATRGSSSTAHRAGPPRSAGARGVDHRRRPASVVVDRRQRQRSRGRVILAPAGDGLGPHTLWAFDLATGASEPLLRVDDGLHRFRPSRRMAAGIVVCDPARCALSLVIVVN